MKAAFYLQFFKQIEIKTNIFQFWVCVCVYDWTNWTFWTNSVGKKLSPLCPSHVPNAAEVDSVDTTQAETMKIGLVEDSSRVFVEFCSTDVQWRSCGICGLLVNEYIILQNVNRIISLQLKCLWKRPQNGSKLMCWWSAMVDSERP